MKKLSYSEQLKHPKWQQRRLEILDKANFSCENCGDDEKTLHVHHRRYVKGRMAWEYEDNELACLCEDCHKLDHYAIDELQEAILGVHVSMMPAIVALVRGYAEGELLNPPYDCHANPYACGQLAWWSVGHPDALAKHLISMVKENSPDSKFWRGE